MLLNNHRATEEIREEIEKYLETNENTSKMVHSLWDAAKSLLRGQFIAAQILPQETRKISNK